MRSVAGIIVGFILFLLLFYPVRFLGDSLASNIRINFGVSYLVNLTMFIFPALLALLAGFFSYLVSGKNKTSLYITFGLSFLTVLLVVGRLLLPSPKVKESYSELTNNKVTPTENKQLDCQKYALPYFSCDPVTNIKKLPGRNIGAELSHYLLDFPELDKQTVSIDIYIKYAGASPGKPIQVSAEDFSLVDEKGGLGILVDINDKELVPCELNFPRRSQQVFLSGALQIRGRVNFIMDRDSKIFKLIYSPLDIDEKVTFDIVVPNIPKT